MRTCLIKSDILMINIFDNNILDYEFEIIQYIITNIGEYIECKYNYRISDKYIINNNLASYYFKITNKNLLLWLLK